MARSYERSPFNRGGFSWFSDTLHRKGTGSGYLESRRIGSHNVQDIQRHRFTKAAAKYYPATFLLKALLNYGLAFP